MKVIPIIIGALGTRPGDLRGNEDALHIISDEFGKEPKIFDEAMKSTARQEWT